MIYKGKINSKIVKKAKSGAEYAVFNMNDKNFNCWDASLIKTFNEGDNVEIETQPDKTGKYENLTAMKKLVVEAPVTEKQAYHQSIEACRWEALDITIKFLTMRGEKPDLDLVLNMSNVYLAYILGKHEPLFPKEVKNDRI